MYPKQEEIEEKSLFARGKKIERLADELLQKHNLQGISAEKKEWIKLFLGFEPGLELTYDPNLVQHPSTFVDKVERDFQKQVKKGVALPIAPIKTYRQPIVKNRKKSIETRGLNYSWIPLAEIHIARTKIDSFKFLTAKERKELHQKFANHVVNLFSQFDAIGKVDDDHITVDQAASLTTAFSKALVEIQKKLFNPILRKNSIIERGPLFNPKKPFDGRKFQPRNKVTLADVSNSLIRKPTDGSASGQEMREIQQKNDDDENQIFPPQYRPDPNFKNPEATKETFTQIANKLKEEMIEMENKRLEALRRKAPVKKRKEVNIIMTPRKQNVSSPTSGSGFSTPKGNRISRNSTTPRSIRSLSSSKANSTERATPQSKSPKINYRHVKNPENEFFSNTDISLSPVSGVETGACIEGIDRLFSPMKKDNDFIEEKKEIQYTPLMLPDFKEKEEKMIARNYLFRPNYETISGLMNVNYLFVLDKNKPTEEHQNLVELWNQLGLDPDSRLLMAANLCKLCVTDYNSDIHFRTVTNATKILQEYQRTYRIYKTALRYEPNLGDEENIARLMELSKNFKLAEASFFQANQEITSILGSEIKTVHGTISELIKHRSQKINELRYKAGIDDQLKEAEE